MSLTYYIPVNPNQERTVAWKPGEREALSRGISERKHRETADALWLARRNASPPRLAELEVMLSPPPSQDPLYALIMKAIRQAHGGLMALRLPLEQAHVSLVAFSVAQPREYYVACFIRDELVEKNWKQTQLTATGDGDILLSSDFTH